MDTKETTPMSENRPPDVGAPLTPQQLAEARALLPQQPDALAFTTHGTGYMGYDSRTSAAREIVTLFPVLVAEVERLTADAQDTTAAYDDLRRHLVAAHCDGAAIGSTDAEALESHQHEHDGPGTIRNHDRTDLRWDQSKFDAVRAELAELRAAPESPCSTCDETGWIRQEGQIGVPGSGCTHGCPDCTVGRDRLERRELREDGEL